MNYAAILAGGVGSRIKSVSIPKQFVEIDGMPVISYTIKSILKPEIFDRIYIATHREWIEFMKQLISSEFPDNADKIAVIEGGRERMDSITNVLSAIQSDSVVFPEDVLVIHDAARPFVTEKILRDSVEAAFEYGAVVAGLNAVDTMLYSNDGELVDDIPPRKMIFHGQAPDSFRLKLFIEMINNLSDEQRAVITGTSQICTFNNHKLHMIKGDAMNFKITTDFDLFIAEQAAIKAKENIE